MMPHDDGVFVRNFALVLLGLLIVALIALLLARKVDRYFQQNVVNGSEAIQNESTNQTKLSPKKNLQDKMAVPVLETPRRVDSDLITPSLTDGERGKEVFDAACYVCHTSGIGGAPKPGDSTAWGPRVSKGIESLYDNALNGYMGKLAYMPPKGGRPDFSEEEVKAAVDYMVSHSE